MYLQIYADYLCVSTMLMYHTNNTDVTIVILIYLDIRYAAFHHCTSYQQV